MTNSNISVSNYETAVEAFESASGRNPHKTAVIFLGTSYSYSKIQNLVRRFASALYELGVREENKILIYLPNCPQWIIVWLAIQKIGGICVPINPIYSSFDLKYIANDSGASTVICSDANFVYVKAIISETKIKRVIVTNLVDLLPMWKRLLGFALDKVPRGEISRDENTYSFRKLIGQSGGDLPPVKSNGDSGRLMEIIYTSGTTKHPKGVPITHRVFLDCSFEQLSLSTPLFPNDENIILSGAAPFFLLGQVCGIAILCLGGTIALLPRMNLDGLMEVIQRCKVKTILGVPALFRMILDHNRVDFYDLRSLKYCFTGGDVLPLEVGRRWFEKFNVPIYTGYGCTETVGGVTASLVGEDVPPRSVGRVLPFREVRIVDPDTLESVPSGKVGELIVSYENMVTSYWNKEEETAASFIDLDGRKWYRTNDLVQADDKGYITFVDRTNDLIKHKGYRISSSEIEAILQEHRSVIEACVIGVPDKDIGERIKAFVVLKEDMKGITGYDLIKWCRGKMAPYKIPQHIEFRDALPKSKVGKLLRREIRAAEKKRSEKEE